MANDNGNFVINLEDNYNIDNQPNGQPNIAAEREFNSSSPSTSPTPANATSSNENLFTNEAAKQLGGLTFDFKGNLINNEGAVIMSKEDALNKLQQPAVTTSTNESNETSEYFLDEQDNLVDGSGKVIKRKGEYTLNDKGEIMLPTTAKIVTLRDQYAAKGYTFKDDAGNDVTFENDDVETYQKFTDMVATQTATQKLQKTLSALPDVKALMEHLMLGGDATDFYKTRMQTPDYTNLNIADDDINGRKSVLMDYYTRVAKLDADSANVMINMAEDAGKSKELLVNAVAGLKQWQQQITAAENAERESKIKAQENAQKEHWNSVKGIVNQGKLKDITIPDSERSKFFEYIAFDATDDKRGTSQAALDYEALSLEDKLRIDYLIYKKFNFDDLIKSKVSAAQAANLKLRKATVVATSQTPITRRVTSGAGDVDIKNII